jgi:hypothetical protein
MAELRRSRVGVRATALRPLQSLRRLATSGSNGSLATSSSPFGHRKPRSRVSHRRTTAPHAGVPHFPDKEAIPHSQHIRMQHVRSISHIEHVTYCALSNQLLPRYNHPHQRFRRRPPTGSKPHPPTPRLLNGVAKSKPQISSALKRRRICGCPTR